MLGNDSIQALGYWVTEAEMRSARIDAGVNAQSLLDTNVYLAKRSWEHAFEATSYTDRIDWCKTGWRYFGNALHTAQDRFSHTNDEWLPLSSFEHGGSLTTGYIMDTPLSTLPTWLYDLLLKWKYADDPSKNSSRSVKPRHLQPILLII